MVPPSVALSCLLPGSWAGAAVPAPPLAPVFPRHGSAQGPSYAGWSWIWGRSRGHRLLKELLRATVPWKQARQSGLGVGQGEVVRHPRPLDTDDRLTLVSL